MEASWVDGGTRLPSKVALFVICVHGLVIFNQVIVEFAEMLIGKS